MEITATIKKDASKLITKDEKRFLGVPTGISGSHHALKALTTLKNQPGWVVSGSRIEEWRFLGFTKIEDQVYLYGPHLSGKALDEVLELSPEEGLPYLLKLVKALLTLQEKQIEMLSIQTDAVLFLDNGDVFFFPHSIMNKLKDSRSLAYRIGAFEAINHPYLKGEQKISFTIAALVYKQLTGNFSFMDPTVDGIRDKMRNMEATSPSLIRPNIRENIADVVMQGLGKTHGQALKEWANSLLSWIHSGPFREISTQENDLLLAKAREQEQKSQKAFRKKVFLEKNGRKIIIIAAAVLGASFLIGSFLKNALAPRVTKGFTPDQVVQAFYASINQLDHITMEDCVVEKAGKAEINEAIHLYVISKQTIAYEGKSYIVPADEWDSNGRPGLNPPFFAYGVTGLTIVQEKGEPAPVFLATYEKWSRNPDEPEAAGSRSPHMGWKVKDRLRLKQDKDDWVIFNINRMANVPINK